MLILSNVAGFPLSHTLLWPGSLLAAKQNTVPHFEASNLKQAFLLVNTSQPGTGWRVA
jgi:hypothetical protein